VYITARSPLDVPICALLLYRVLQALVEVQAFARPLNGLGHAFWKGRKHLAPPLVAHVE